MNSVNLIGRLTADIDIREYGKGKNAGKVGSFRLAVRDGVDADGEERTQFINCTAWNKTAELIADYCGKGKMLGVSGRLVNNNYEKEDGTKVYTTEVVIAQITFIDSNNESKAKPKGKKYTRDDYAD